MPIQVDMIRVHYHPKNKDEHFEVKDIEQRLNLLELKLDRWEQKEGIFEGWFKNSNVIVKDNFANVSLMPTDKTTDVVKKEINEILTISKTLLPNGKVISLYVNGYYKPKTEPSILIESFIDKSAVANFNNRLSAVNRAFADIKVSGIEFSNFGPVFCNVEDRPCNKEAIIFVNKDGDKLKFLSTCIDLTLIEDFILKLDMD